jgi:hypothetical protein
MPDGDDSLIRSSRTDVNPVPHNSATVILYFAMSCSLSILASYCVVVGQVLKGLIESIERRRPRRRCWPGNTPRARRPRTGIYTTVSRHHCRSSIAVLYRSAVNQVAGVYVVSCVLGTIASHGNILDKAVWSWWYPTPRWCKPELQPQNATGCPCIVCRVSVAILDGHSAVGKSSRSGSGAATNRQLTVVLVTQPHRVV